jgi:hypothetical protein
MRAALDVGAYQARSRIASAQRCVNLYAETNPEDAPVKFTYYPAPGHTLLAACPTPGIARGHYRTSQGTEYAAVGMFLYSIGTSAVWTQLGMISNLTTPVDMTDNGTTLIVVDGTVTGGWQVTLATNAFSQITDPNFLGGVRCDFIDTYFMINQPNTPNWYISLSNSAAFDSLDFAGKTGYSDGISGVIALHDEAWLIGNLTTEVWYNSGASNFTFQKQAGVFIHHGCIAPYSICKQDQAIYYVSQDEQGQGILAKTVPYEQTRISTHAIEAQLATYPTLADCIAYCWQQNGHSFVTFDFPTADKSWTFDESTQQWHERVSIDSNGNEHRPVGAFIINCYNQNLCLDHATGALYRLDQTNFTDNGMAVVRRRGFPHNLEDGKRVFYTNFVADLDCGQVAATLSSNQPQIYLRRSKDRGYSWTDATGRPMGSTGQYNVRPSWWRMGMAPDMVFELFWSINSFTALNGAFVQFDSAET